MVVWRSPGCARLPAGTEADAAAAAFQASQPLYLRPFPYTPVPKGITDLRPETCGACHQEIYQEWKVSTHAHAWEDAQFQAELAKQHKKGWMGTRGDARWMCVNCHIPLENQHETQVIGLKDGRVEKPISVPNQRFMPDLVDSAIGCATCHVKNGIIYGPYGDTKAPHPVAKDEGLLTPSVCLRCHQAEADFPALNLTCVFRTGTEFEEGPYPEQGYRCQTCHMPEVERPLVAGMPSRTTRRHWFGGSLIPKKPEYEAELAPLREVYPDGLTVEWVPSPATGVSPEQTISMEFIGKNAFAGHRLPTGDPERFITVTLTARDGAGKLLATREERIGSVYQWYPEVKLLSDNRLAPLEERRWKLEFPAPSVGPITLHAVAEKHRLTRETMEYHQLDGKYVASRRFLDKQWMVDMEQPNKP